MVRQYIGARYVPKFYENSQNPLSNDWEANVTYEALTVVTYLSDSYTSKKPVPVTVGNPRDNNEYWALTGAYNAQIEDYRRTVNEYKEDVDNYKEDVDNYKEDVENYSEKVNDFIKSQKNFTGRRIICLGDSYGGSYSAIGSSWVTSLQNMLPNNDIYNKCVSGAGFAKVGNSFLMQIQDTANIPNHDTITDIVLIGGVNDVFSGTMSDVESAAIDLINYINIEFPKANVWFGYVYVHQGWATSLSLSLVGAVQTFKSLQKHGYKWITNIENSLAGYISTKLDYQDTSHPSPIGNYNLARNIVSGLLVGSCSNYQYSTGCMKYALGERSGQIIDESLSYYNDSEAHICSNINLGFYNFDPMNISGNSIIKLLDFNDNACFGGVASYTNSFEFKEITFFTSAVGESKRLDGVLCADTTGVYLIVNPNQTANDVIGLTIPRFSLSINVRFAR